MTAVLLPVLTRRLRLREFVPGDLAAVRALTRDERILEYTPTETRALEAVRRAGTAPARRRRSYELAVELRRGGRLVGACDLALDGARSGDIGYMLAPRHWGHGYGTELACALVEFGFGQLGLRRLAAVVAIENDRSRRVLEKAGFVWDGLMRRHLRTPAAIRDCHRYVIDRERWASLSPPCAAGRGRGS
ncbi:MAG: GNAT family N-acetyltransferase [Proteobacteria bacterium]|nr:GNAT family N-acetyltransferase [Pseudomonadota bacterium]